MTKVRVSSNFHDSAFMRQTPGGRGVWKECTFVADGALEKCDVWVVFDGLHTKESAEVPEGNSVLVTCEASSSKSYNAEFVSQFDVVLSPQDLSWHPGYIRSPPLVPWWIGVRFPTRGSPGEAVLQYEDLVRDSAPKCRQASVICSDNTYLPGHRVRLRFVRTLARELRQKIDVFGYGATPLHDKWDAIAPYRYHVAIENSQHQDYWTEKLADAYLGAAFPIYCGCTNICDYFEPESLAIIDINDTDAAIDQIRRVIESDAAARAESSLKEAKRRILEEYNFFEVICRVSAGLRFGTVHKRVLKPESEFVQPMSLSTRVANRLRRDLGRLRGDRH